jgi:hypothetical protein
VASVIDEHVSRLDIFVYEALPMDLAESFRQANGDAQDASQIERLSLAPLQDQVQGLTARVREDQDRPPFVTSECQRLSCPCRIEFRCEREFVLEPSKTLGRGLFFRERHGQNRRCIAALPAAVKSEVRAFPERLQYVLGRLCY